MPDTKIPTIIERFYHWEETTPNNIFLRQPKGDAWKEITYAQAGDEVRRIVTGMKAMGLKKGDHIGIYSKNCYHWMLADLACHMGGYVSVPFYASLPGEALKEVIKLGDLKGLFIGKLDKWNDDHIKAIPKELKCIKFPHYEGNAAVTLGSDWNDLIASHGPQAENYVPDLEDLWTIKFTSGTTGTPKGVMHLHRTPASQMVDELRENWMGLGKLKAMRTFSFLPLNHVGERIGIALPTIWQGGTMSFAEGLETFVKNIQETQPTIIFAVPRIWTNFYLGVLKTLPEKRLNLLMSIPIISSVIKKSIKKTLGLGSIEIAATGAAITPAFIKEFYKKLDIHLIEAYGMTEVCGSMTNTPMRDAPLDVVGKAIPGGEVRIDGNSGEVLMKSPYMMTGYYKAPEKTAEVLQDGWLQSGDRGKMDNHGFLRIVGRVKDAFKTSKGSYITPNPLEEVLAKNDFVEQVCVVGLGIPQPIALYNLSEIGKKAAKADVEQSIISSIAALNETRAKYEHISTAIIQDENWTMENEFLTPTLKVKRFNLDATFGEQYLAWHECPEKVVWC